LICIKLAAAPRPYPWLRMTFRSSMMTRLLLCATTFAAMCAITAATVSAPGPVGAGAAVSPTTVTVYKDAA
jgi:hypothetical protein